MHRKTAPVIGALFFLSACTGVIGSGNEATDSRETTEFSRIQVSGGLEVEVQVGKATSVLVSGDDNVLPVVATAVEGEGLTVGIEPNTNVIKQRPLLVIISTPTLAALSLEGGSKATVVDQDAEEFSLVAGGGSEATVTGKAAALTADASGGSKLFLNELLVQTAQLKASGGSQIAARVYAGAHADASDGARIDIRGGAEVEKTETGGARVTSD